MDIILDLLNPGAFISYRDDAIQIHAVFLAMFLLVAIVIPYAKRAAESAGVDRNPILNSIFGFIITGTFFVFFVLSIYMSDLVTVFIMFPAMLIRVFDGLLVGWTMLRLERWKFNRIHGYVSIPAIFLFGVATISHTSNPIFILYSVTMLYAVLNGLFFLVDRLFDGDRNDYLFWCVYIFFSWITALGMIIAPSGPLSGLYSLAFPLGFFCGYLSNFVTSHGAQAMDDREA